MQNRFNLYGFQDDSPVLAALVDDSGSIRMRFSGPQLLTIEEGEGFFTTEEAPVLPTTATREGFVFELDPETIAEGQTIWIDPIVAVGYEYVVEGAGFAAVTAPSFDTASDPDGYLLSFLENGALREVDLLGGQGFDFLTPVQRFWPTMIDPALGFDPNDDTAFVTGVALAGVGDAPIRIAQIPITLDTDAVAVAPVHVPPAGAMLAALVGALGWASSRRRAVARTPR